MNKKHLLLPLLLAFVIGIGNVWGADYYVKVTQAPTSWEGQYLIVYEAGKLAFDGSLSSLDATSNSKSVTIKNDSIEATTAMDNISFTITADASNSGWYQVQSASGYYIAGTTATSKASNGLKSSNVAANKSSYLNQPGVGQILSKSSDQNMTLRYNKADNQTRFRYYKSGQEAITLYKKVVATEPGVSVTPA